MVAFDVTDEPVFSLGIDPSTATYTPNNFGYDFALGEHAFLNANGVTRSASTAFASFTCDACGAQSRASTRKHGVVMRGVR